RRRPAGLGQAGTGSAGVYPRRGGSWRLAVRGTGTVVGRRHGARAVAPRRAVGTRRPLPRRPGSAGLLNRAWRARTRGGGPDGDAHHGFRRHRAQRFDVRDFGERVGPSAGTAAILRGTG